MEVVNINQMPQTYTLLLTIKGSINWIVSRRPTFYQNGNGFVGVYWKINEDQDYVYDMFNYKDDLKFYYRSIKSTFESTYPTLTLDVKYTMGPVEFESEMYSRIVYYYYDKSNHQKTNTFFAC